jgi:PAS domain S-box-containing protein
MDTTGVNLWADALDIINEPVLFFGTDGTVHNANPAALSFYGIDEADLLGMHCYEMVRRFGLRFSDCPYERVLKTGTAESGMIEYNGAWYTHRVEPVSGRDGAVQGMISVVVNGDEPVRLQAASEQLQFLFEATNNAVLVTGSDQRIIRWNHIAERMLGYPGEYLRGRLISDFVPLTARKSFLTHADRAITGEHIRALSLPGLGKGGYMRGVSVSMAPLHDPAGTVSGMVLLSREDTGESAVDIRLVSHLSDLSVRIKGPLSHMRMNMEDTVSALQEGLLTTEELVIFLTIQMKSIRHIEENLREINTLSIDGIDSIPEEFWKILAQ